MRLEYVSQSVMEDYLNCPYLFYLRHKGRGGVKPTQRQPRGKGTLRMKVGQGVHKVAEIYFKKGKAKAAEKLIEYLGNVEYVNESLELLEDLKETLDYTGELYFEEQHVLNVGDLPELRVAFDIVERDNGRMRVIELKTGYKLSVQRDIEESLEARYYRFMLDRLYPGVDVPIIYYYLRHDEKIRVYPLALDLVYIGSLVSEMEIRTDYAANFGYCQVCPFITTCDIKIEGSKPEDVAAKYLHHQALSKAYFELLKGMAKDKEIELGGYTFYWGTFPHRKIVDYKRFMQFLRDNRVYVKPDMSVLDKKHSEVLRKAIMDGLVEEKRYPKFYVVNT